MIQLALLISLIFTNVFGTPDPEIRASSKWRIIGGSDAPEGAFPYQVSIRASSGNHVCGGSIIDSTTILTAAHCVYQQPPFRLGVAVGSNLLNSGGTRHRVSSIRSHEGFNTITLKNDIAILKLSSAIVFSSKIQPIELETSYLGENVGVVLSGWGRTSHPGPTPNHLQYIFLQTTSVSDCRYRYRHIKNVDDSQICTLTRSGQGACRGDSGGPLVANGVLIGIVSWGRPCAVGYPDVYTRVSYYIHWINRNSH